MVPLFVFDPALTVPPNRARFLAESVAVLRDELRERGGDLVIRRGEPVSEVIRLARQTAAEAVFVADDVSRYAALRQQRLARECDRHRLALEITPGHAVVPPGDLKPSGGDHYRIFTPYWRAWRAAAWRQPCLAPPAIRAPARASRRATRPPWRQPAPGPWRQAESGQAGNWSGPGLTARLTDTARAGTTWPPMRRPG